MSLTDPREGPYLSDVLAGKDARDVLADRIATWADTEDWHVYDYADRLIADLDAAGYEIVPSSAVSAPVPAAPGFPPAGAFTGEAGSFTAGTPGTLHSDQGAAT